MAEDPANHRLTEDRVDPEHIEKVYSSYSSVYDVIFGKIFHQSRCEAIELVGIQPGDRILEVGVGTGLSLPLYPQDCQVVGIDLSAKMLEKGEEKIRRFRLTRAKLARMDASFLAFGPNSFDGVVAAYVMSAVPDPWETLREMIRVCKPGGKIVLLNHFHAKHPVGARIEQWISPLCTKIGFRSDLDLGELLHGSGLQIVIDRKVNPFGYWTIVQCVKPEPRSAPLRGRHTARVPIAVSS